MNKQMIHTAMQRCDQLVLTLDYTDSKGEKTHRAVSPIRFLGSNRFLALCLCRCEPRQFQMDRCSNLRLRPAVEFVMPVQISAAS